MLPLNESDDDILFISKMSSSLSSLFSVMVPLQERGISTEEPVMEPCNDRCWYCSCSIWTNSWRCERRRIRATLKSTCNCCTFDRFFCSSLIVPLFVVFVLFLEENRCIVVVFGLLEFAMSVMILKVFAFIIYCGKDPWLTSGSVMTVAIAYLDTNKIKLDVMEDLLC